MVPYLGPKVQSDAKLIGEDPQAKNTRIVCFTFQAEVIRVAAKLVRIYDSARKCAVEVSTDLALHFRAKATRQGSEFSQIKRYCL